MTTLIREPVGQSSVGAGGGEWRIEFYLLRHIVHHKARCASLAYKAWTLGSCDCNPLGALSTLPPTGGHGRFGAALAFLVSALVPKGLCNLWRIRVKLAVLLSGNGDNVLCAGCPLGAAGKLCWSVILCGGS